MYDTITSSYLYSSDLTTVNVALLQLRLTSPLNLETSTNFKSNVNMQFSRMASGNTL